MNYRCQGSIPVHHLSYFGGKRDFTLFSFYLASHTWLPSIQKLRKKE